MPSLMEAFASKIPSSRDEVGRMLKEHGEMKISDVTVSQAYGGMRSVKCMVTETSALDPMEGIRFRGYTIPSLRELLPKALGGEEPLPEGLFYLLLTGDLPSPEDVRAISAEWRRREGLPAHVKKALDGLPMDAHPMTQFSMGILAMQTESVFAKRYREGVSKTDLWKPMYEDTMNLLANVPHIAAYVYRRSYRGGEHIPPGPPDMDWGQNFAHMLGYDRFEFHELMRLYLVLHADHEGGNVSAHTIHLVGSALSDAYLSLSAGMDGLAGPLHGLANQEVIRWILDLQKEIGAQRPTQEQLTKYVWDTLNSGRVVPGFGHAVLRKTDPRYMAQREFALKHMADDEIFHVVSMLFGIVPPILEQQGKAKNPWPNVDAHSGCLLLHYGMQEFDFYTVLFGVSRAMGTLASLCWDRALNLPLERPKSVTTGWLKEQIAAT
jgi:citrate synthase